MTATSPNLWGDLFTPAPHPNKMTVDLCDTNGLPLSEEEQGRIPRFQRAMRSTVGAILFALVAFTLAPTPLVYIGGSLPILLWAGAIKPRSARLIIDYCCNCWIYLMVVSEYCVSFIYGFILSLVCLIIVFSPPLGSSFCLQYMFGE